MSSGVPAPYALRNAGMALTAIPALLPKGIERDDLGIFDRLFRDFQLCLIRLVERGLVLRHVFLFGLLLFEPQAELPKGPRRCGSRRK